MVLSKQHFDYQLDTCAWLSQLSCQRAWVEIDHSALIHNVREIKKILSPQTEIMAVVKADAYGHGAVSVAQTVLNAGCSSLAVATLTEGIELRQFGITAPILILGATNTKQEVEAIARWQLEPTLCNHKQALLFSSIVNRLGVTLPVHLKLDTGMCRLGMPWEKATDFASFVQQLPGLKIASIYSHLATADEPDPTMMNLQHQRYQQAIASLQAQDIKSPCLHLANSAATLSNRCLHYDLVRIGLALYGLYPAIHLHSVVSVKPVLKVKARVTQVKTIPPGTGVSYGHQFVSQKSLNIAVVGIGYADGVPRRLSNCLQVLLRGELVRQIGAITMDQLMLDVSRFPDVEVGEVVTLIGQDGSHVLSADDWATTLGTISWEVLCGFKHRLPRVNLGFKAPLD